jgi:hypothetical protein
MKDKKYRVPEGLLKSAVANLIHCWDRIPRSTDYSSKQVQLAMAACEAGIGWLAENPIMPTMRQLNDMYKKVDTGNGGTYIPAYLAEWQRIMFLAPEPAIPEAVQDLLYDEFVATTEKINEAIIKAYRRGREGR